MAEGNAEQKDQMEGWAARMACSRRIPLSVLQRKMARDWVALYRTAGAAVGGAEAGG